MDPGIVYNLDKRALLSNERIFLSPPHMSGYEQQFVQDAFDSNYVAPLGPQVDAFEAAFENYTGINNCVALSSGTAAIHLALRALGVGPGDEVFASTLTFIASITPVIFLGARPVFIDCDRESWNMDPDLLAEALLKSDRRGQLPKAVIVTDLYGQCADYDRLFDICNRYGVPVIVDAAEAMGARYETRRAVIGGPCPQLSSETQWVHAGKGARAAVFSFNGNNIITTSGGGMLASDDRVLVEKARFLSQQARDPRPHYEHSRIGYNYRMSNIAAAIGLGQLEVLNRRISRKREIFDYYQAALGDLAGIGFMPEAAHGWCTRWLTVILISPPEFGGDREAVRLALEAENIESRPVWKPMHLQPVFDVGGDGAKVIGGNGKQRYQARLVGGTVSEELFEQGLCLPSGTAMRATDIERVVAVIRGMGLGA